MGLEEMELAWTLVLNWVRFFFFPIRFLMIWCTYISGNSICWLAQFFNGSHLIHIAIFFIQRTFIWFLLCIYIHRIHQRANKTPTVTELSVWDLCLKIARRKILSETWMYFEQWRLCWDLVWWYICRLVSEEEMNLSVNLTELFRIYL